MTKSENDYEKCIEKLDKCITLLDECRELQKTSDAKALECKNTFNEIRNILVNIEVKASVMEKQLIKSR